MQVATTGLVLRQVKVGEADRILTVIMYNPAKK